VLTVLKSGSFKLLKPLGLVPVCDGIALGFLKFLAVNTSFVGNYELKSHAMGLVYLSIPVNALVLVKL